MGRHSGVQWTHHTFNPWWGCEKISEGCANCYAAVFDKRLRGSHWGKSAPRRFMGEKHWRGPLAWDVAALKAGERHRVFCASMADVFEDREDLLGHRWRLFKLIEDTPNLDWLLLTKRPERIMPELLAYRRFLDGFTNLDTRDRRMAWIGGWIDGTAPPANVWLGTTVEDQEHADRRIPELMRIPAAVRFLSMEPLLGPVNLFEVPRPDNAYFRWRGETGAIGPKDEPDDFVYACKRGIHWIIVGGESGAKARPFDLAWARSIRDQCAASGVPCFVKQLGARPFDSDLRCSIDGVDTHSVALDLEDSHGGDWDEWPEGLRVRELPRVEHASIAG